jgi:hypothetical protein
MRTVGAPTAAILEDQSVVQLMACYHHTIVNTEVNQALATMHNAPKHVLGDQASEAICSLLKRMLKCIGQVCTHQQ